MFSTILGPNICHSRRYNARGPVRVGILWECVIIGVGSRCIGSGAIPGGHGLRSTVLVVLNEFLFVGEMRMSCRSASLVYHALGQTAGVINRHSSVPSLRISEQAGNWTRLSGLRGWSFKEGLSGNAGDGMQGPSQITMAGNCKVVVLSVGG